MDRPVTIGLLPLPMFTLTPFSALLDVIRLAADEGDRSRPVRLRWTVVGLSLEPVTSSCGVALRPWEGLGDPARFDVLVLCGGLLDRDRRADEAVRAYLNAAAEVGVTIVSLCTAVFDLAESGLLDGRRACVSWFHAAEFRARFARVHAVASQLFVEDGTFITCSGGTGAADVGALIVERHLGAAPARKALDILLIEEPRGADHPQPTPVAPGIENEAVRRAILAVEERLDRSVSIDRLAALVGLSRRQLERQFVAGTGKSPQAFIAELRLRYADWMVRATRLPQTEIAQRCGFADSSHFARNYRAHFGVTPSAARRAGGRFAEGERRPYRLPETGAALGIG
jgi:transcriptional regulator GlxA family with amidase domain